MGIDVVLRDSAGDPLDTACDAASVLSAVIERIRNDRSRRDLLASTIDPYGQVRFSTGQASRLLREFEMLRAETIDLEERIALGHVIAILRAAECTTDQWLEFDGD
jgi:hypothetical protein